MSKMQLILSDRDNKQIDSIAEGLAHDYDASFLKTSFTSARKSLGSVTTTEGDEKYFTDEQTLGLATNRLISFLALKKAIELRNQIDKS